MKRIVIILIGLISVAYGQSQPTSAKTRFVNGLYLGTKLDSYFAVADSNAIYWRADSVVMAKYKGTARALLFVSDSATYFDQVVRTFGTQTVGGNKTFSNNITINTIPFGAGVGSGADNIAIGTDALSVSSSTNYSTAVGFSALKSNTGTSNSAFGGTALLANTTGQNNTGIGRSALSNNTDGSRNVAIGILSGTFAGVGSSALTSVNNSTYIGADINGSAATGVTNETVIGYDATGNGSNTVTIGNSSVTDNYFSGNIRGSAFIRSGGTSSQFLKADGSVDGTSYATSASLSGYLPLSGGTLTGALNITNANINLSNAYYLAGKLTNGTNITLIGMNGSDKVSLDPNGYGTVLGGSLNGTSLSMSGAGSVLGSWGVGTASPDRKQTISVSPTSTGDDGLNVTNGSTQFIFTRTGSAYTYRGVPASAGMIYSNTNIALLSDGGVTSFHNNAIGEIGRWATDGTFLINTTTTDGTNKLIVNGGVKVSGDLNVNAGTGANLKVRNNGTNTLLLQNYNDADFYRKMQIAASSVEILTGTAGGTDAALALTISSTGSATFSSSVTATGFIVSSDRRLKNIIKRDGDVAYYKWKDKQDDKVHIGYIAQEVQKTNPDQVSENNGKLAVNYIEILVEKVRALEKEIEQLKRKQK